MLLLRTRAATEDHALSSMSSRLEKSNIFLVSLAKLKSNKTLNPNPKACALLGLEGHGHFGGSPPSPDNPKMPIPHIKRPETWDHKPQTLNPLGFRVWGLRP